MNLIYRYAVAQSRWVGRASSSGDFTYEADEGVTMAQGGGVGHDSPS